MAYSRGRRISFATFLQPAFGVVLVAWALNEGLQCSGTLVPLLQYHGNDFLCLPLVLSLTLFLQRNFSFQDPNYVFTPHQVGIAVVYVSLLFEGLLPHFMDRYTADWLDVLAYALGGVYFQLFLNQPPGPNQDP